MTSLTTDNIEPGIPFMCWRLYGLCEKKNLNITYFKIAKIKYSIFLKYLNLKIVKKKIKKIENLRNIKI